MEAQPDGWCRRFELWAQKDAPHGPCKAGRLDQRKVLGC